MPLDVRVLDANGYPVTDLTASDFAILERGIPQRIAHYSTRSYPDTAPEPRTFVILMGRGRLNATVKAMDAAIDFLRTGLRPSDRVGLIAWLHAVDPTTDHAGVLRLLERAGRAHERIEDLIDRDGKRAVGPNLPLSEPTRTAIRDVFNASGVPRAHQLPGGAGGRGLSYSDFTYLRSAIDYLRQSEGEKHLVFVLEGRPPLTPAEAYRKDAAAARVTITPIPAGGVPGLMSDRPRGTTAGQVMLYGGPSADHLRQLRLLAEQTGGLPSVHLPAAESLARLARSTSFQYVFGYYPANPPGDREYRPVRVTVSRKGVVVLTRDGYEAESAETAPVDLRQFFAERRIRSAATESRVAGAPSSYGLRHWFPWKGVTGTMVRGKSGEVKLEVDIEIDATRLAFLPEGPEYTASLDIAVLVDDERKQRIGEEWERFDFTLDEKAYARRMDQVIKRRVTMAVAGDPTHMKVLAFEYAADRVGLATANLRQPD